MPYIFHVDVNSAFLSWSALKQLREEPGSVDLRTIPSAVGGDIRTRHGIITAKSIPAKKYGVQTGEPVVKALQKCPQLVLVKSDFVWYRTCSHAFMEILRKYSDIVQQASIDEAYMDMTAEAEKMAAGGVMSEAGVRQALAFVAGQLRDEIRGTLGFTVNVGISTNRLLAKTASDFQKPDRTHTLFPEEIEEKFWPLPIGELHGCGPSTSARLQTLGIRTVGDAAHADPQVLRGAIGEKAGEYIFKSANGQSSAVVDTEPWEAKSISNETTLANDITAENFETDLPPVLAHLAAKVGERLRRAELLAGNVGVMVKTSSFRRQSRQEALPGLIGSDEEILAVADRLMRDLLLAEDGVFASGDGVRLVGVAVSALDDGAYEQLSFW